MAINYGSCERVVPVEFPKNPTLGNLQGLFERTIQRRGTWVVYAHNLDRIIQFLGASRKPEDVFRLDIEGFKTWLKDMFKLKDMTIHGYLIVGSSFYTWMEYNELVPAGVNPFRPFLRKPRVYNYEPRA